MEQTLLRLAADLGFANASLIDTADIVFRPEFRPFCADNVCGKYGASYACPPLCGTVEEMDRWVLGYRRALVLQTMWDIEAPMDEAQTKPAKSAHNRMTRQLIERSGLSCLHVGAGGCDLCSPCASVSGGPCPLPDQRFSCMSAYCVFVKELADRCGMEYDCGPGIVAFFSMLCFDPVKTEE